jgi:anti-sigma factor RsiW
MKTSWNDIELIDRYLSGLLAPEEMLVFERRLQVDTVFKADVRAQAVVRKIVREHYLLKLRDQAKSFHRRLHNDPSRRSMRSAIEALFKN